MIQCRDENCSSAFAKQTIARQGDLPAFQQSGTLDLPAANCIRSECRTSDARPYVRVVALRPAGGHVSISCVGTSIARPRLRSKQSPGRAISLRCSNPLRWICLRQIAFVLNAGRAMLVPTGRHGKNVGTSIARPRLRSKQSPGRAISLRFSNPVRWICLRQIAFVPNAGRAMLVPTQRHGKNVGTRIARPRLRSKQSPGRAISLHCSNPVRWICLRQIAFVPNAGRAMLVPTGHHGKNVGTRIARPRLRSKQSPGRAISLRYGGPGRWICLRPTMETSCDLPAWRRTRR